MDFEHIIHDAKFWVGASFVIFIGVYIRYISPLVNRSLDARIAKISDELAQAKRLREEAEEVLASYKAKEALALKEAEELLSHAREETTRLKAQAEQSLKESVERRIAQANAKIERAETDAVEHIRTQIVDTAIAAVKQVLGEQLAVDKKDPTVEKAISAIGRIVH